MNVRCRGLRGGYVRQPEAYDPNLPQLEEAATGSAIPR
jgi:hypothetical protein